LRSLPSILISASALILAIFALWEVRILRKEVAMEVGSEIQTIDRLAKVHAATVADLAAANPANARQGLLPSYLAKIRLDGLPAHRDFKQKLDVLERTNTELMTLIDLYLPHARTADFATQARAFRLCAAAWNDRWNTLMEYYMAGGNLPSSEIACPPEFAAAVAVELAAAE